MRRFYRTPKKAYIGKYFAQNIHRKDIHNNGTPQKMLMDQQSKSTDPSEGQKILTFIGCTFMIFICQVIYGVVEERVYKVPYKNLSTSEMELYTDPITPMLFSTFFGAAIGYMRMDDSEAELQIPMKRMLVLSVLRIAIHFGIIWALMSASYVLVVMANSCGLLSVILVGVYFSQRQRTAYQPNDDEITQSGEENQNENRRSSDKGIGPEKILICLIVFVGIFIFNYFAPNHHSSSSGDSTTQSASIIIFVILAIVILLQGLYPQFQNKIKQEYQPSSICFYYNVNKVEFITISIIGIVTWQVPYTFKFILNHDELFLHIIILALLNSFGILFIYKIITLFRQHVYPLVSTVRKCITVTVSILYFGHHISFAQFIGIILVFGGVLLEISINYNLLKKWDINLPFVNEEQSQRYVKNKHLNKLENNNGIKKKYEVYKVIQKQIDAEGI